MANSGKRQHAVTHSEVSLTCKILAFSSKQPRCHRSADPTAALFHIYNPRLCDYRLAWLAESRRWINQGSEWELTLKRIPSPVKKEGKVLEDDKKNQQVIIEMTFNFQTSSINSIRTFCKGPLVLKSKVDGMNPKNKNEKLLNAAWID